MEPYLSRPVNVRSAGRDRSYVWLTLVSFSKFMHSELWRGHDEFVVLECHEKQAVKQNACCIGTVSHLVTPFVSNLASIIQANQTLQMPPSSKDGSCRLGCAVGSLPSVRNPQPSRDNRNVSENTS